eukprot:scaffold810_cov117-Cylindrotheca_fusiformis.AAC.2
MMCRQQAMVAGLMVEIVKSGDQSCFETWIGRIYALTNSPCLTWTEADRQSSFGCRYTLRRSTGWD